MGYTVIHVGYCSGDAHGGNVRQDFEGPGGSDVVQTGYNNTASVVRWMKENIGDLQNFVVSGSSAGSLAVQLWSRRLLQEFTYANAAVIADSYAGVFPRGVQGRVFKSFGVCSTDLLSPRLRPKCDSESLTVQDAFSAAMYDFPDVAFASINSKTDFVQILFHDAMVYSKLRRKEPLGPSQFYSKLAVVENFYSRNPNHVTFDVNSINHVYVNNERFYSTVVGDTSLNVWLGKLPVQQDESVASKCEGALGNGPTRTGWDWCQPNASRNVFHRDTETQKLLKVLEEDFEEI